MFGLMLLLTAGDAIGMPPSSQDAGARTTPRRAQRTAVEARLRAYDLAPSGTNWNALGTGADEVLVEIGADAKIEPLVRARAVSALAYLVTPAARKFLEATVVEKARSTEVNDRLLLRRASVALGWHGGAAAMERLAPLLDNAEADVRLDAVIGLGLTRLPSAADLLRKRIEGEKEPRVRNQMGRQVRMIEDALAHARPPSPKATRSDKPEPPPRRPGLQRDDPTSPIRP